MYATTGESLSLAVTQVMKLLLCVCVTQATNTYHVAPPIMSRCGLPPCYCPDKMHASSSDVVAYTSFTAQSQCKPHQVKMWLTPLLLPRHNACLIRCCCGLLSCYCPNNVNKVAASLHLSLILQNLFSSPHFWFCGNKHYLRSKTSIHTHWVMLWLTPLLLSRHNVCLIRWCCALLQFYSPDTM